MLDLAIIETMTLNIKPLNLLEIAAYATWAVILGISLWILKDAPEELRDKTVIIVSLFVVYLLCFIAIVREGFVTNQTIQMVLLALQLLFAFALMLTFPVHYLPILTIIWISMLPYFTSLRNTLLMLVVVIVTWNIAYEMRWHESIFISSLLYATFHFFAVLMIYQTKNAEDATLEAERLNQELQATQHLLAEASRQNERSRIARDLHDLLGHHLTALIINLQVAGRLSDGVAGEKIDQCHSLSKLLLSDVREAVSALRESENLDFHKMIDLMLENISNLKVHAQIEARLQLEDIDLAKSLLSCIQEALTNSMRHSGATEFWLTVVSEEGQIKVTLVDNGHIVGPLIEGNGLTGMRERVAAFAGKLDVRSVDDAMSISIGIPLDTRRRTSTP